VTPDSSDEKMNVGVESAVGVGSAGPASMVAAGAVVSTVKFRVAQSPGFESASRARTDSV
jgi:hypothetical protein